jgi:hypothetical protein
MCTRPSACDVAVQDMLICSEEDEAVQGGSPVPSVEDPDALDTDDLDVMMKKLALESASYGLRTMQCALHGISALFRAPSRRVDSQGKWQSGGRRRLAPTETVVSLLKVRHGAGWINPLSREQQALVRSDPAATMEVGIDHTFRCGHVITQRPLTCLTCPTSAHYCEFIYTVAVGLAKGAWFLCQRRKPEGCPADL